MGTDCIFSIFSGNSLCLLPAPLLSLLQNAGTQTPEDALLCPGVSNCFFF